MLRDNVAPVQDDIELASVLARSAGHLLRDMRTELMGQGVDAVTLKDLGDAASQDFLSAELGKLRAGDAVLSEEAADGQCRLDADRVWIIDPLDGTREFSEGRDDWAVHVALWSGGQLIAGAVALPALELVLNSRSSDHPVKDVGHSPIRMAVSRSRPSPLVQEVAAVLNAEVIPMGSAGYKACAVIRGEADVYLHSGGQFEWDTAAPVAVAASSGFHTSRIDGSALQYNQPSPYLPDVLICRKHIAPMVLGAIQAAQ